MRTEQEYKNLQAEVDRLRDERAVLIETAALICEAPHWKTAVRNELRNRAAKIRELKKESTT